VTVALVGITLEVAATAVVTGATSPVLCHVVLPQSAIVANATSGKLDTAVRLIQSLTARVFGSCCGRPVTAPVGFTAAAADTPFELPSATTSKSMHVV